ncbi:MAG TPA: DUF4097 family beta strand repeat-containing protein [Puia sp.]|nr:DUF4097 family beta strand repeat-containing protein [Puia sp.]
MKKLSLLLIGGLAALTAGAQYPGQQPFMTKTFPRAAVKDLDIRTSGGNISVQGEASGDARVEVFVSSDGRHEPGKEEIRKMLDEQYDLEVGMEGNKLVAIAKQKAGWQNTWRRGLSISFRVFTPEAVGSHVRTSGGNISMKNLSGSQDFKTSGGNLDIDHLTGTIVGRTSGGNVSITDSHDDIDLSTSGGNMDAARCEGKIGLETSGGNVSLRAIKGTIHARTSGGTVEGGKINGELQAHTSGGNIDLDEVSASLEASTSGGNIHVDLVSPGKYVDLSNSGGDISLNLPQGQGIDLRVSGDRVHTTTMSNFRGDVDEHHINGTLNGGGIPVKVDGGGGQVHLSFK